jgi:hypothetical protein
MITNRESDYTLDKIGNDNKLIMLKYFCIHIMFLETSATTGRKLKINSQVVKFHLDSNHY